MSTSSGAPGSSATAARASAYFPSARCSSAALESSGAWVWGLRIDAISLADSMWPQASSLRPCQVRRWAARELRCTCSGPLAAVVRTWATIGSTSAQRPTHISASA